MPSTMARFGGWVERLSPLAGLRAPGEGLYGEDLAIEVREVLASECACEASPCHASSEEQGAFIHDPTDFSPDGTHDRGVARFGPDRYLYHPDNGDECRCSRPGATRRCHSKQ